MEVGQVIRGGGVNAATRRDGNSQDRKPESTATGLRGSGSRSSGRVAGRWTDFEAGVISRGMYSPLLGLGD